MCITRRFFPGSVRTAVDLVARARAMRDNQTIPGSVSLLVAANVLCPVPEDLGAKIEVRPLPSRPRSLRLLQFRQGFRSSLPPFSTLQFPSQAGAEGVITQPPLLWRRFDSFMERWAATPASDGCAMIVGGRSRECPLLVSDFLPRCGDNGDSVRVGPPSQGALSQRVFGACACGSH